MRDVAMIFHMVIDTGDLHGQLGEELSEEHLDFSMDLQL
jgi:hypothetical protein